MFFSVEVLLLGKLYMELVKPLLAESDSRCYSSVFLQQKSSQGASCLDVCRTVVGIVCKDGVVLVRTPQSLHGLIVSAQTRHGGL